jgi:hypothetical protein
VSEQADHYEKLIASVRNSAAAEIWLIYKLRSEAQQAGNNDLPE